METAHCEPTQLETPSPSFLLERGMAARAAAARAL